MLRKKLLIQCLCFIIISIYCAGFTIAEDNWVRQLGTIGSDYSNSIATDGAGGVYIAGVIGGSLPTPSGWSEDVFLAKYDTAGNLKWTKQFGTGSQDYGFGVASDGAGGVYITGSLTKYYTDDWASPDVFLTKYDTAGNLKWTNELSTNYEDVSRAVVTDGAGSVYITGYTGGNLGGPSAGSLDAFLAKYDTAGDLKWTKQLGTSSYDLSYAVTTDGAGSLYITGETGGSLGGLKSGVCDAFLAKYDTAGDLKWTKQLGTSSYDVSNAVTTDGDGNVYIAGTTYGSLGGYNGERDAFLAKYDTAGNLKWTKQLGTIGYDDGTGVLADSDGNVYITGYTTGNLDGPNSGSHDAFLAKYDTAGNLKWTKQLGTSSSDWSGAVATDGNGNIYITGGTEGSLGGVNAGRTDAFLAKFSDPLPILSQVATLPSTDPAKAPLTDLHNNLQNNKPVLINGLEMFSLVEFTSSLSFDKNKPTAIIIHGWNNSGDQNLNESWWMKNMASFLQSKYLPDGVNILAWNWLEEAKDDPLHVPNEKVSDQAANLASRLDFLFESNGGYSGEIQVFGNSLGAGIGTRTAIYMENLGYNVDRLVLMDAPTQLFTGADVHLDKLLAGISENVLVENLVSFFGAFYTGMANVKNIELHPSAWGFNLTPLTGSWGDPHEYAHYWYGNTILDQSLSVGYNDQYNYSEPYLEQSINFFDPKKEYVLYGKSDTGDVKDSFIKKGSAWWRPDQEVLSLSDLPKLYVSGNVIWDQEGSLVGYTNSPVFISSNLNLPMDAKYLSFDLQIMQWNDGDIFAVYWNETQLMSFFTDFLALNQWYNFPDIDMSNWLGTDGTLTFAYFTQEDGIQSQFGLRNIGFYNESASTPEPTTMLLLVLGLIGLAGLRRRLASN